MKHASRMTVIRFLVFALAALCLFGCGDEDTGDGGGEGGDQFNAAAPKLSSLFFPSRSVTAGEESRIAGLLDYEDSPGDVREFFAVITDPDGNVDERPPMAVEGRDGQAFSTLNWTIETTFTVAGTHRLEVYLVDAQDNRSNSLFGTINVVE